LGTVVKHNTVVSSATLHVPEEISQVKFIFYLLSETVEEL